MSLQVLPIFENGGFLGRRISCCRRIFLRGSKCLLLSKCIMFWTPWWPDNVNCYVNCLQLNLPCMAQIPEWCSISTSPDSHRHMQLGRNIVWALVCSWSWKQTIACIELHPEVVSDFPAIKFSMLFLKKIQHYLKFESIYCHSCRYTVNMTEHL